MSNQVETTGLKAFVETLGVDVVGISDLRQLEGIPIGLPPGASGFLGRYQYAVVMGAQLGKVRPNASGDETSIFLEKAALELAGYLSEQKGYTALIVHAEDEFDPVRRVGLMSLKALARGAGLGWQGRSLLIVSPKYGPLHRLIAVLTDMPLQADQPLANRCGDCSLCVDKCPRNALTLIPFKDHPAWREDVLDIELCLGDEGCKVCLVVCPWANQRR